MVGFTSGALASMLVASAAAGGHRVGRHQYLHQQREYTVSPPPVETTPAAATYSVVTPYLNSTAGSTPAAASGVASPSGIVPSGAVSNTWTSTSTSTIIATLYSTVTVVPIGAPSTVPEASSPAAASGSPAASGSAEQCAPPVTVTVTAPSPSGSSAHKKHHKTNSTASYSPSTSPAAASSSPAATSYAATSPAASTGGGFLEGYSTSSAVPSTSAAAASAPASSTPATPTSASSGGSYSGGKRGVAFGGIPSLNVGSGVGWAWNWSPSATGLPKGVDFVPIMNNMDQASDFPAAAASAVAAASYPALMGVNEPDMTTGGGGSALTPSQAAAAYQQYLMPFAGKGVKLGSPSVTSDNSTNSFLNGVSASSGLAYLSDFKAACTGCQVDFVCLHWYGSAGASGQDQATAFQDYVEGAIEYVQGLFGAGTTVWITEFSALPTIDQDTSGINQAFIQQAVPYLESAAGVERYSYFAATPGLLTNSDGSLTSVGEAYVSL